MQGVPPRLNLDLLDLVKQRVFPAPQEIECTPEQVLAVMGPGAG